jgi:hypothetical protein
MTVPFTDVAGSIFFCAIAEAYFSGLTNGTSPTTYSPSNPVPRDQMAAFITRTLDQSLRRGSQRAALEQWWTPKGPAALGFTDVGDLPRQVKSDGADLWVASSANVTRVRASDGKLMGTYTGMSSPSAIVIARGRVYVTGHSTPGTLYVINPAQAASPATLLTSALGDTPTAIAYDGSKLWIAAYGGVSRVTLDPSVSVTSFTAGLSFPVGILFDGFNIWVTDNGDDSIKKLDSNGAVLQTIPVGEGPRQPVFDGTNIWVPSGHNAYGQVTVIRAATGAVLATLTGNGLLRPETAAFDGQRILVTNIFNSTVSLWKAADLSPLGFVSMGDLTDPVGACSDGRHFWIALQGVDKLARF